jgi:hypothetical protein
MAATPPDDYHQRQRANMLAIAIVVAIVAATVLLLVSLQHGIKRESCFAAGHRTCAPVDEQQ